jgi:transcriptional regulator with XRE-family HTH domain
MPEEMQISGASLRELFGYNLKRLRNKSGMSQLTLAMEADLTHNFINDMEHGKKWLSCRTIARLCKVLRTEPCQFFLPRSSVECESPEILSTYIDDFSNSMLRTLADFKNQYLYE